MQKSEIRCRATKKYGISYFPAKRRKNIGSCSLMERLVVSTHAHAGSSPARSTNMDDNRTPLHMGDWTLYRDTGSLFHKKCKRFHNTMYSTHLCEYGNTTSISYMIVTTVNICRDGLRANTWSGCRLPNIFTEAI